jgi:hypothetical protein
MTVGAGHGGGVPQLCGKYPPHAQRSLAVPQLPWHRTLTAATIPPPSQLTYMRARYIRLVRFLFLILIGRFATLEP